MKLYERVRKTPENKYGLSVVVDNPFIKPSVLLIMSSELYSSLMQPVNGGLKRVLQMARLMNNAFEFNVDNPYDFPVRFVAVHALSNPEPNWQKRLVDEYFSPLLSINNKRLSLEDAKRNVRNLNIVSYCGGIDYCDDIEKNLIQLLSNLKYNEEEIEEILNEIFLMGFSSPFLKKESKFTSVIFNDINDDGVYDGDNTRDDRYSFKSKINIKEKLEKANNKYGFRYLNDKKNQLEIIINGGGEHSFKKQYLKEKAYFALISMTLSYAINNALQNSSAHYHSIEFLTQNIPFIVNKCCDWEKSDINKEELEKMLDESIEYFDVVKQNSNNENNNKQK